MENQTVNKVTPKIVDLTGSPVEIGAGHGEELFLLSRPTNGPRAAATSDSTSSLDPGSASSPTPELR